MDADANLSILGGGSIEGDVQAAKTESFRGSVDEFEFLQAVGRRGTGGHASEVVKIEIHDLAALGEPIVITGDETVHIVCGSGLNGIRHRKGEGRLLHGGMTLKREK